VFHALPQRFVISGSTLRRAEVPHHPHVFVFEDMTVVEVQARMMCECDLHSNGFSGEHKDGIPPPAVNDAGTQRVRASARSIKHTKLSAVHVNRMGGLHTHRVRQILELPELRRARGNGFLWGDIGHGKRAAAK